MYSDFCIHINMYLHTYYVHMYPCIIGASEDEQDSRAAENAMTSAVSKVYI